MFGQRRVHPVGEGDNVGRRRREIVGEAAGADHPHVLLAQCSDRAAKPKVVRRPKPALQRELQHGDVVAGIHQRQRHPGAVVQAAFAVDLDAQAGLTQQRSEPLGEFR
jgi:hypothetical protein